MFIICKALMVYGQCSGDERAAEAVYRAMKNLEAHLTHYTLFNWGQSRWFEALIPLQWIYEQRPEAWMIELAVTLASQGLSYERLFSCWKDQQPDPQGIWRQQTHIVNLMMALKSEAVFSGLSGQEPDAFARKMYAQLCEAHGTPMGHIQGDECLAGRSPIRGTELCAVVEEMYSCEVLASVTGDPFWLDLLERLAFNSLPATISADMWSHQYDQQLNQVSCSVQQGKAVFGTNWYAGQPVWAGTQLRLLHRQLFSGLAQAGAVRLYAHGEGRSVRGAGSRYGSVGAGRCSSAGDAGYGVSLPGQPALYGALPAARPF